VEGMEHSEAENIFIAFVVTSLEMFFSIWEGMARDDIHVQLFAFSYKKELLLKLLLP
jgi:hypothetical protein